MALRSLQPFAAALALLAGCASTADFPSLAPRDVERRYNDLPPPTGPCAAAGDGCYQPEEEKPAPTPVADDAALRARIAQLTAQAEKGQSDFAARLDHTTAIVNRAGAVGSDGWVEAQQELSRLEAARAQTLEAVNALDALALERSGQATSESDLQAINEAAAAARKLSDAQQAAASPLRTKLNPS